MNFIQILQDQTVLAVKSLYQVDFNPDKLVINPTRKDIEGDFTLVVFPFTKIAKKGPEQVAQELGIYLAEAIKEVESFNVVKGFLNFTLANAYWMNFLAEVNKNPDYGKGSPNGKKVLVEYSSPNTNKPLHLGHIRNILLGWSVSQILDAAGYETFKVQIVNDRGIHICKSMLAWQKFGKGETPESAGLKGDHLIGKYYVKYSSIEKEQKAALIEAGKPDEEPAILQEARAMLLKWEDQDPEIIELWKTMNSWVYKGFEETYKSLGVHFDKYYYESNTYLLGKDIVEEGLNKGLFYEKADGSVWIDLEDAKLDHKIVRRSDGTSVYITQDLGTAQLRYQDFGTEKMVYVVGDEQEYHFKVLFEILKRMGEKYAEGLFHLSYGMVNLPSGRMKSREGTVVDADDLMTEVITEAESQSIERATLEGLEETEKKSIWRMIGMAALKYYILNVSPKKSMIYNPSESLELQGKTGPYIQNAFVRIHGVNRKMVEHVANLNFQSYSIADPEKELMKLMHHFPSLIQEAASKYDPSEIAHFAYDLAKAYHRFYHDYRILAAESEEAKNFRLALSKASGQCLKFAMELLGIDMPERM